MKNQKTFAQRAQEIERKFKDRNDSVSLRTKEALMQQLRDEQEALRQQMEAQNTQGSSLDQMGTEGINQAMFGSLFSNMLGSQRPQVESVVADGFESVGNTPLSTDGPTANLNNNPAGSQMPSGEIAKTAMSLFDSGNKIFGKSGIDTSGASSPDISAIKKNNTKNLVGGVAKTGAAFATGDIVGGITGAVETLGGIFGGNKDKRAAQKAEGNHDQMLANNARPDSYMAALGGYLPKSNKYFWGGPINKETVESEPEVKKEYSNYLRGDMNLDGKINRKDTGEQSNVGKALDWLPKNIGNIAQYAPAIGPLTNKIERGVTERGSRMTGEASLGRRDENRLLNEFRAQSNVSGNAREGSGGSLSAYNTLARSGHMNEILGMSQARQVMEDSNLSQREKEVNINERNKAINMQADDRFLDRKAQDEGAYQSAKQLNRAAIFDNIGSIGREEVDKKIVKEIYDYSWDGEYVRDDKGGVVIDTETNKPMTKEKRQQILDEKKLQGKTLKTKKKKE